MKISLVITIFVTLISTVSSHTTISFPPPRGHPLNPNAAVQDFQCISAPLNGGSGCAPKKFPCGGYPRDKKVVTTFRAGEVFEVKFFNQNFPELREEDKQKDQVRHNGGLCEFALSYDGGKTYTVIATYKKTCPDIFFDGWKVKIPEAAPSCDDAGECLFSWSWINAVGNREFYQNCADVKIVGNATEPLPIIDITRANLPPLFNKILTPEGDDSNNGNAVGSGPRKQDVKANLALNIGGGRNKNPPKEDKPPKEGDKEDEPEEDEPKEGEPKEDEPEEDEPKEGEPKEGEPKEGEPEEDEPKQDKPKEDEEIPCDENGTMACAKEGVDNNFFTCDNGKWVSRTCPGVLVCTQNGKTIFCDFPKEK